MTLSTLKQNIQDQRSTIRRDAMAGLIGAVAGAPQAMGFAIIAGISPMYGLYTSVIATIIGALTGSSTFMTIAPTNAVALVVGSTLLQFDHATHVERLFVLTLLVGAFQVLFGVLKVGDLMRFVSNAVMTGFITGAGLLIILGQMSNLTGYTPTGNTVVLRFLDWVTHLHESHLPTAVIGGMAILIIGSLYRTRWNKLGILFALIATTLLVHIAGWERVALVRDMAPIAAGLPGLIIPDFSYIPGLLPGALAMAVLASVQSAAITNSIPNPGGNKVNTSRDLLGMGTANVVGAFFQGMPAAGSLSRTAVNVAAGARTRMANVLTGVFIALLLIFFGNLIERIPLAALAGHLIVAAVGLIRLSAIRMVWLVNISARLAMVITFIATLVLPLEYSIYAGVGLTLLLYAYSSAHRIEVARLVAVGDGHFREAPVPERLPDDAVTVLGVRGNLYFAAIERLEELLPNPALSHCSVVILRMRGNQYLGSTGIRFVINYARKLEEHGGMLILTGISAAIREELEHTGLTKLNNIPVFHADDIIFHATEEALVYANAWLEDQRESAPETT